MNDDLPPKPAKKVGLVFVIIAMIIYIANPTAGFFELIPDNFPIIGNLDEAAATALLIKCVMMLRKKKKTPEFDIEV